MGASLEEGGRGFGPSVYVSDGKRTNTTPVRFVGASVATEVVTKRRKRTTPLIRAPIENVWFIFLLILCEQDNVQRRNA